MTTAQRVRSLVKDYNLNEVFAARAASEIKDFSTEGIREYLAEKPKPFVKWVGGKRQLLSQFKSSGWYPPIQFNSLTNTYFEPFVGGGAVFFDLFPRKAVLSDMNSELVTTYNIIKTDVALLIAELQNGGYMYEKSTFLNIRTKQPYELSPLQIAARFIYLNRTAFNGMYRVNSKGEFNVPFGKYNNPLICDEQNLYKVSNALKQVSIRHQDYKNVLNQAKKGDFVYFDPPYYPVSKTSSFTAYTVGSFLEKEQVELKNTYLELHRRGCFLLLSNSDTPFVKSLYRPYEKEGITISIVKAGRSINSNAKNRGKVSEVVVTNYANF